MTAPSAPCSCPVPAHHYGSPSSCPRPAAPGMSFCYGCHSSGHDRLGPCSPASHRRDYAHDPRYSRDLCGDCALLGDPGSYAPFATRYGTCVACGADALVTRATKITVDAARTMLAGGAS